MKSEFSPFPIKSKARLFRGVLFVSAGLLTLLTLTWLIVFLFAEKVGLSPRVKEFYLLHLDIPLLALGCAAGAIGTYAGCKATGRNRTRTVVLTLLAGVFCPFGLAIQLVVLIELFSRRIMGGNCDAASPRIN